MAGSEMFSMRETTYDYQLLLKSVNRALSQYVNHTEPSLLFLSLLNDLLHLTDSEYGLIGELLHDENGSPYVKAWAISEMDWEDETRKIYEDLKRNGMIFKKKESLYGAVLKTCKPVISNDPQSDLRSGGVPKGHPPLNAYLGLPICCGDKPLGVVSVANRPGGYDESIIDYLQPFLNACGSLLNAYNHVKQRRQVEQELRNYKQQLETLTGGVASNLLEKNEIEIGNGFLYDLETEMLYNNHDIQLLTPNETKLLHLLVQSRNRTIKMIELESAIWNNRVTGESSLRALMRRLRKKIPGVQIQTFPGVGYMMRIGNEFD